MLRSRLSAGLVVSFAVTASFAVVPPQDGPLRQKELRHSDLFYDNVFRPVAELPLDASRQAAADLSRLGVDPTNAYFDLRTGRWGTVILTQALIPGSGVGNRLSWSDLGRQARPDGAERERAAWEAFRGYLVDNAEALRIDVREFAAPKVQAYGDRVIHIHVGRQHLGIPVRDTFVKATINSGNLVLLSERNWGTLKVDIRPAIVSAQAEESLLRHLEGIPVTGFRKAARLEIVPVSSQAEEALTLLGAGLEHRLVWVLTPTFDGDPVAAWEALVDAHSGELLALQDTAHYASRRVEGWIYPVSNDGVGDDGTLQPGFPLPFADLALDGESVGFSTTGGNAPSGGAEGLLSTELSGRYLTMNDTCGVVDESAAAGDLDLDGIVGGTDCAVPPGHSAGDTNSTRSAFYEINRIQEQARGYLPGNGWLNQTLTANMNIVATCNASWNGSVNFFRSGGGCSNTGELAGVFDHEWGHGMDNNDNTGTISNPGEGIADIYAQNRLNTSCIGRNFRPGVQCQGYGDGCLDCTGIRDTDWAKRVSGQPHDIAWIDANCGGGPAPCGGIVHCEGAVYAEAVWDLVHRDFMGFDGSPWNLDLNTALELGTRLTYFGSSNVGSWYQCVQGGTGGCNGDGGYLNYLAADDDNGDLTDGTPHMSAIFAAFDRHDIACPTPAVTDFGCAGGPATAPANITATPINEGAQLTWDPVTGASEYWIFRAEGVHGCDFGKALVGTTTSTSFTEIGLRNGFEVLYGVVAVGDSSACTSPMSACEAVTPVEGPGIGFDPSPPVWAGQTGDGDEFFDNCETGTLSFGVINNGVGALTDVRIVEASIPSHPEAEILTSLPSIIIGTLPEGDSATAELLVVGGGFAFGDTLELEVTVTADELDPLTLTHTYTVAALESDLQFEPSLLFSFEDGDDGWQVIEGIFDRTDAPPGGANGTAFYRASSTGLDLQCDLIRSPLLQLTETSTLELFNQFDIEDFSGGFWWDRANMHVFDPLTGERTVVSPDSGRPYNADGTNPAPAPCPSADVPGWASDGPDWVASGWSADALGSPDLAGQLIQLDVAYGTDPAVTGTIGFWFDEVTLTDVFVQVPDAQSDDCGGGGGPIADISPEMFDFTVPVGGSEIQTLNIGNIGDEVLDWAIEEAESALMPETAPYAYGLAAATGFHAPVGSDRASGIRRDRGEAPANRVVLPAPQPAAIGDFTEGFDDITMLPGAGWALINNSEPVSPSSWFQGNGTVFPSHEGDPDAYIAANYESTDDNGTISNWLLTPEVTIVNGTQLCFWTRTTPLFEEFLDRLEVRMSVEGDSTDVGETAESVGDFPELLLTIEPDLELPNEYPEEWTEFCLTVRERPRQPVTGRFAFRYWVTDSGPDGTNGDYIGIDTVSVTQPDDIPPGDGCDNPVDIPWLAVDPTSGTTAPGGSEPVTVAVDTVGLEPGEHTAQLCVTTNDPAAPLVEVPVSLTVTAADGVLLDNGPIVTHPGAGPGGTDHSTLQNVTLGMGLVGVLVSQPTFRIADDFEVPGTWDIDTFTFFVYQTGSDTTSIITAVNYRIWDGPPVDPESNVVFGDTTTNRLLSTEFSNAYRVSETLVNTDRPVMVVVAEGAFSLQAGTYWVDAQFDGSLSSGPFIIHGGAS